jgi:hypothetical protein
LSAWIHGAPGIGKTESVYQYAKLAGLPVIKAFAPTMDIIDVKGALSINSETQQATFSPLSKWISDKPVIVLLDELPQAPTSIQNALSDLLLNHEVGELKLHKDSFVVATGNRQTDRAGTNRVPSHVINRCWHIYADTSPDEWLDWAIKNDVHKDVIAFGNFRKEMLHNFKPELANAPYATYRSWVMLSDVLKAKLPSSLIPEASLGLVGEAASIEFTAFCSLSANLPKPEDILANPSGFVIPTDMGILYAVVISVALAVNKDTADAYFEFLDLLQPEFAVMGMRTTYQSYSAISKAKPYFGWMQKHKTLVL